MNKLVLSFILALTLFAARSQERILSYDIHIDVEKSGDLLIREEIKVTAQGDAIRRGIYRSFPTKYKDRLGNRFNVGFEVKEVLKNGTPEPWFTEKKGNGIVVYIGDRNIELVPGTYTYSLTFRTTRQIGYFDDFDELYFNAIGGDWAFTIENAVVTLRLPEGAEVIRKAAYSGYAGSTSCDCTITAEKNVVTVTAARPLQPQEQLTFAVAWPRGIIPRPSGIKRASVFLKDNLHILLALTGFLIALSLYFRKWKAVGKDPARKTIIPLFDPPEGFSPAATGYLIKMGMNNRVITSALVNMAVKGYMKIHQEKKDYFLELVPGSTSALSPEEQAIASALFAGRQTVYLDNAYHNIFQSASQEADKKLKALMVPEYYKLNRKHLAAGGIFSLLWGALVSLISPSPAIPVILFLLFLGLVLLFAWLMKAPTSRGRELMDETEGFKMYLSVAEKEKLNLLHEPDLTVDRFEKLLPFAIALGVENQWGRKFENTLATSMQESRSYHPAWYAGAGGVAAFSPQKFTSTMGKSFSSAISSASTPPGSSSGSGGGGSSGGGGGGGGGGGW